jgi:hypothetical protein
MMASLYRKLTQIIYSTGAERRSSCVLELNSKLVEERLDRVYIYCSAECRAAFLFRSDVDDHKEMSGHGRMHELSFS